MSSRNSDKYRFVPWLFPCSHNLYSKDLSVKLTLRVSSRDLDFLRHFADSYGLSLSGAVRLIVRFYASGFSYDIGERSGFDEQQTVGTLDNCPTLAPNLPR